MAERYKVYAGSLVAILSILIIILGLETSSVVNRNLPVRPEGGIVSSCHVFEGRNVLYLPDGDSIIFTLRRNHNNKLKIVQK